MINLIVTITGGIALKLGRKEQAQVNEAIALDLQDNLRTRFEDRGGRSFWADAARATVVEPDGNDRLAVRVYKRGVRHQWLGSIKALGGPLRASGRPSEVTGEPTKNLAIPTDAAPYGLSIQQAGLGGSLVFVPCKGPATGVLVGGKDVPVTRGPRKGQTRRVANPQSPIFYILMREVTIPEHPDVMPDNDEMRSVAEEAVHDALDFLSRKKRS